MSNISNIKEVTALFKDRAAKLPPTTGKPTNDDLERLHELFRNLLQAVKIPGGNNTKGLITTKDDYKAAHTGSIFDRLDTPLEAYDPAILSNITKINCMQAER